MGFTIYVYLGWPFFVNAKPGRLLQTAIMTRYGGYTSRIRRDSPAFSFSEPAQLDLGHAKGRPTSGGNMSPNPTSMTFPARIDNTTAAKQVVTFFLFWRSTPSWACPRTRPPFERPAFTKASTGTVSSSRPMSSRKAGRSRSLNVRPRPRSRLWWWELQTKGHHLFRRPYVVILGRNHCSSRIRCLYVLVYQG